MLFTTRLVENALVRKAFQFLKLFVNEEERRRINDIAYNGFELGLMMTQNIWMQLMEDEETIDERIEYWNQQNSKIEAIKVDIKTTLYDDDTLLQNPIIVELLA